MRLIEAIFPSNNKSQAEKAVEECKPTHWRFSETEEADCVVLRAFFAGDGAQELVDKLQNLCDGKDNWRIIVMPVEATAPKPEQDDGNGDEQDAKRQKKKALREEIYDDVADGASLSTDFFILTVASTIVAALGLNANNVAAVIGAMVIAPLLGPILAVSLGTALGDFSLITRAGRNAVIGLSLGFATSVLLGLWLDVNFESNELMSRTVAGLDSVVLALAAGVAAALSIVTGISAALVGVMVAVALLPPAAAAGLFFGAGEFGLFARSMLLLTVNIVCILIAAQAVYFYKGVRPRTWLEQKQAGQASKLNIAILVALLLGLVAIITFAPTGTMPDVPGSGDESQP